MIQIARNGWRRNLALASLFLVLTGTAALQQPLARAAHHPRVLYLRAQYNLLAGDVDMAVALARAALESERRSSADACGGT